MLSLKCSVSCMVTIDGVDKSCPQILYRVDGNSLQIGISATTMTTTQSRTSTAIRRAWSAGTSLQRRAFWRGGRHVASELSRLEGQVDFLFSLPRCWQSHTTPGRWFFADVSRGMLLVALRNDAESSWSQSRIYLRQPAEWSRFQSRIDILTLQCMLTQHS